MDAEDGEEMEAGDGGVITHLETHTHTELLQTQCSHFQFGTWAS